MSAQAKALAPAAAAAQDADLLDSIVAQSRVAKSDSEHTRARDIISELVKEVLAGMGLHLGMEITNWPPENIEDLAKKLEEPF